MTSQKADVLHFYLDLQQMPCYVCDFLWYIFQRRTREKLMNVLSLCGPESGLPKNPSVSGVGGLFWFLNSSSENAITFSGIGKVMKSGF